MFVYGVGVVVWIWVGCPIPLVRNDIVTPRHLFMNWSIFGRDIATNACRFTYDLDSNEDLKYK